MELGSLRSCVAVGVC